MNLFQARKIPKKGYKSLKGGESDTKTKLGR